jgi:topoisomerase-4 subunit A
VFADERRTLIQEEKKAVAEVKVIDEPVTVVVSDKGWVRARTGHGHDPSSFAFKAGDELYDTFECRTVDQLIAFGSNGRVYSVPVASLPGARGDGQPVTTLVDVESGTQLVHYFAGPGTLTLLLSNSGGYGFVCCIDNLISRNKGGKAFINLAEGRPCVCRPWSVVAMVPSPCPSPPMWLAPQWVGASSLLTSPNSRRWKKAGVV